MLLLLWSCNPKQYNAIILPETEQVDLDTLVVTAPRPVEEDGTVEAETVFPKYNPSAKRLVDLIHTKLDLRFDWKKEQVLGKATLTLKPYFYPVNEVTLDAKGFEFHTITREGTKNPLKYDYDGQLLTVKLDKSIGRNEEIKLFLDYTATPRGQERSGAITSDKGLFFINPDGSSPSKPQQIWTQGETENNSRWFPTIDKPNERCTQELYLTVENRFRTLSNGILVSSKPNGDGTRTDYWKMDQPHAPYLFMIAVGEYAVIRETWKGKPVEYYVEPEFEPYAKAIFPYTPEMLAFFSDKLNLEYPWQKYSQVVVRDYVSGAMENTTAVIFGEFMQRSESDLLDDLTNEKIVAHEMFHHWFGNYVTCESWANLTMNEGFANYSEYLWLEHKYGKEEADFHRYQELQGYLESSQNGVHPLIHFSYQDKEDMFDAHSYNKGGLVLHMLRNYVGDAAFFEALHRYLSQNAYTDVEAHELRLVFEDVTGEDLNWFFNQWFFEEGHPELNVAYDYDDETKEVIIEVEQIQKPDLAPSVYVLPVGIDIYSAGAVSRLNILINERKQTFRLKYPADPDLIVFDGDGSLLAVVHDTKSNDEYTYQYLNSSNIIHRLEALTSLAESESEAIGDVVKNSLNEDFWLLRMLAVNATDLEDQTAEPIRKLLATDPHSSVRQSAAMKLSETGEKEFVNDLINAIEKDKSIRVVGAALEALQGIDESAALGKASQLEKLDDVGIVLSVSNLYASAGDTTKLVYFERIFDKVEGYNQYSLIENYTALVSKAGAESMLKAAMLFKKIATGKAHMSWLRFKATESINELHSVLADRILNESDGLKKAQLETADGKLKSLIVEIVGWEEEPQVKDLYNSKNFPDPK